MYSWPVFTAFCESLSYRMRAEASRGMKTKKENGFTKIFVHNNHGKYSFFFKLRNNYVIWCLFVC